MAVDLSGQRLWAGEYEIREKVAQGGMATVYSAYARSLDTNVAVKVLSPRLARDASFLERFHAEATSIAGLHHPNIIEVHHFGEENGAPYIAMRYVGGGTLKERLQEAGGLMDLRAAARLIAQVASALQYAHERGLIHLDVKPANVLLGSADWPLLSDFGITRIAGDAREDGHRVAGTPAYMSPEQWQGLDVDGRSDQYSLALTFYEMVTGRRPFSGETSAQLKAQHLSAEPPRPRDLNPGIPGPVEEVLLRAMAKDREDRFPTIGEFGTALVEAVEESRGMQLETKQAMVAAAPSLVALLFLSAFAPLLASLANGDQPVFRNLTLDWPILLVTALIQTGLLLGVRWHLIGLATRAFDGVLGRVERLTRATARGAPRESGASGWRRAAVGSAEGLVSIAYLFVFYQLLGQPVTKIVTLAVDRRLEDWVVTGIAALVLAVAAGIVLRVYRRGGAILAVVALAVCWGFVSSLTIVDREILDGRLSVQWLAKLGVGLAVLVAFLAVRRQVQGAVRGVIVPALSRPFGGDRRETPESQAAARQSVERGVDAVVNVAFLVVGYPIVAASLRKVLEGLLSEATVILLVSFGVVLVAAALVNRARARAGTVPAALGLLICAPTLMALPVFTEGALGSSSLSWVPRVLIGAAVVAIFLGVRKRLQALGRQLIVPALDDGLSDIVAARSEEQQAQRRKVLDGAANALVDALYLVAAYFVVVGPVAVGLGDLTDYGWVAPSINLAFLVVVAFVAFRLVRGLIPALRRSPVPAAP